ncbi:unnamed protein product [Amoebophrya sp. A25]|nr:unnamed protein product [Amoebophrya sp. A25]|eukprot:GSA25T00019595001.1
MASDLPPTSAQIENYRSRFSAAATSEVDNAVVGAMSDYEDEVAVPSPGPPPQLPPGLRNKRSKQTESNSGRDELAQSLKRELRTSRANGGGSTSSQARDQYGSPSAVVGAAAASEYAPAPRITRPLGGGADAGAMAATALNDSISEHDYTSRSEAEEALAAHDFFYDSSPYAFTPQAAAAAAAYTSPPPAAAAVGYVGTPGAYPGVYPAAALPPGYYPAPPGYLPAAGGLVYHPGAERPVLGGAPPYYVAAPGGVVLEGAAGYPPTAALTPVHMLPPASSGRATAGLGSAYNDMSMSRTAHSHSHSKSGGSHGGKNIGGALLSRTTAPLGGIAVGQSVSGSSRNGKAGEQSGAYAGRGGALDALRPAGYGKAKGSGHSGSYHRGPGNGGPNTETSHSGNISKGGSSSSGTGKGSKYSNKDHSSSSGYRTKTGTPKNGPGPSNSKGVAEKQEQKLLERSSVARTEDDRDIYFDAKPPNFMLSVRMPDVLRELYYMTLFYMIDFRRYEKRRLQVMRKEQFHLTIAALRIETDEELQRVRKWMDKMDFHKLFQDVDLEGGDFRLNTGPVINVPMHSKQADAIEAALENILAGLDKIGIVAKAPPRDGDVQLYMTLVKHRKYLTSFSWDRSFSNCSVIKHLCSNGNLEEYDWEQRKEARDAIEPLPLPDDSDESHPITTLDLCRINGNNTETEHKFYATRHIKDYYEVCHAVGLRLHVGVKNLTFLSRYMQEIEAETGKRLKMMTETELDEHEEQKRQRRLQLMEQRRQEKDEKRLQEALEAGGGTLVYLPHDQYLGKGTGTGGSALHSAAAPPSGVPTTLGSTPVRGTPLQSIALAPGSPKAPTAITQMATHIMDGSGSGRYRGEDGALTGVPESATSYSNGRMSAAAAKNVESMGYYAAPATFPGAERTPRHVDGTESLAAVSAPPGLVAYLPSPR